MRLGNAEQGEFETSVLEPDAAVRVVCVRPDDLIIERLGSWTKLEVSELDLAPSVPIGSLVSPGEWMSMIRQQQATAVKTADIEAQRDLVARIRTFAELATTSCGGAATTGCEIYSSYAEEANEMTADIERQVAAAERREQARRAEEQAREAKRLEAVAAAAVAG